ECLRHRSKVGGRRAHCGQRAGRGGRLRGHDLGPALRADGTVRALGRAVLALARRMSAETDRYGRFVLWGGALPDTLVARFIGRAPDTLVVDESAVARELTFRLRASPVPIAGIVVPGDSGGREVDVFPSRWSLPREAMAAVPSA